jgi:cystathionine beta-lyase/cystathionine gamma-synthase
VESVIEHSALMPHASVPAEQRAAIGIEHVDDLIAYLDQTFQRLSHS